MADPDLVLINTNRMRPPIGPIGLDYVAGALAARGFAADLVDLTFAEDAAEALRAYFAAHQPRAVGLSFRNTDDCYLASRASFVGDLTEIVRHVRAATEAPVILGGSGYSVFPAALLRATGADFGVLGDGEEPLPALLDRLRSQRPADGVPGLVVRDGDVVRVAPPQFGRTVSLATGRDVIDNARYFREGGQGGFETRRGCGRACIYCADPVAKGRAVRLRPPREIADEVQALARQGVDVLHTCDPEFNIPPEHGLAVCAAFAARGLGERVRWYTYCAPAPFPAALAAALRRAGCVGVNFGADSGSDAQLARLGRGYGAAEIAAAVHACHDAGLAVMIDLLFGGPGETPQTCAETIAFFKSLPIECAGAPVGVRLYPGTPLAQTVLAQGPLDRNPNLKGATADNDDLLKPVFYVDRALGDDPAARVIGLIAGDERFFPPVASRDVRDYNYNDNTVLTDAIAAGARGAYWHILSRLRRTA
jgi:radical SAM superfamily enzyme YgiQ (UPF0313 family)